MVQGTNDHLVRQDPLGAPNLVRHAGEAACGEGEELFWVLAVMLSRGL